MGVSNNNYTGSAVNLTVPAGVTSMVGDGAGAQAGKDGFGVVAANLGGRLQFTLAVTPGDSLEIFVAGVGQPGVGTTGTTLPGGTGGLFGGANGGSSTGAGQASAGGGGGESYIKLNGVLVAIMGGAGGNGGNASASSKAGGWALDTEATTAVAATAGTDAGSTNNGGGGGGGGRRGGAGGAIGTSADGGTNMAHSTKTSAVTSTPNYQAGNGYVNLTWTDPPSGGNRSFPVPVYTILTQLNGATKLKLSTTSPGTTDDTATKGPSTTLLAPTAYYLTPEGTATTGTLNAVGTASGKGWGFVPSANADVVPLATDGWYLSAGTVTFKMVGARDNGITSADQIVTYTAILFRANSNATSFPQELGRATSSAVTFTTTKTEFSLNITTAAATFAPGEILWLEVFASTTSSSSTGSIASYYTNSTTAMRLTAAPNFYRQYVKALADSIPLTEAVGRQASYKRGLADSIPLTELLTSAATFRRALNETIPTPTDVLKRVYTANRQLAESIPLSENINRLVQYKRLLNESIPLSETLTRQANYSRALADNLTTGGGSGNTFIYPVIIFDD